jgi:predicted regulator of Ras-like GTPase activity (Roadblock/LC7/MglB family)
MSAGTRGSGVESRLLDLLEYRVVHGAVITTIDGLLVANAATSVADAEQLAATAVSAGQPDGDQPDYSELVSEYGAIRIISGSDLRLIVITDSDIDVEQIRPTLVENLLDIEHMIRI